MRIVVICTLYPPHVLGGAEISTSLLAKGLVEMGHEVSVITTGNKDNKNIVDGVTVYRIKNKNIYWRYPQREKSIYRKTLWHFFDIYNIRYQRKLSDLLDSLKPEIVHTGNLCGLSCVVWNVAHEKKIPIVHTLRDYYLLCPQQTMIKGKHSCKKQCLICWSYSLVKKNLSQKVDAIVGISDFILRHHQKFGYFSNTKVSAVIPNSVEPIEHSVRKEQNKCIGYIGRLSPEKGIELMIESFLNSRHVGTKLLIAGNGNKDYEKSLKDKYCNDDIVFCGKCKPEVLFASIDLLIVPSLWNEPFGRVVIEAYSAHVPVLMANNGGLAELVEDGISKLFTTDSKDTLTKLLNEFFEGKLHFDTRAFDSVSFKYTQRTVIGAYLDLYEKTIKSHVNK